MTPHAAQPATEADRLEKEQRLRVQAEARCRSLWARMPDVVWSAGLNRDYWYISPNVAPLLGATAAELIQAGGAAWFERIHPADVAAVRQAHVKLFTAQEQFDVEYRLRRADGQYFWVHDRALPPQMIEGVQCAEGILTDITQRRQVEAALEQAKNAAEAASRAKSQFLANMSHELRTPLNAIIGFSEMLIEKSFGDLNDRQLKYTQNILTSGRHLLQLINDIIDLSKVESGRLELYRAPFGAAKAVQDMQVIVRTQANQKGMEVDLRVTSDLPSLNADEAKFKRIVYNLLHNAIKFTPDHGRVQITLSVENRGSPHPGIAGECIRVSVADTGIGVKPQDQARIFEEFFQVDSTYGRQQQGAGLGLALAKKLVELHQGRIWVESDGVDGHGSTFSFLIPTQAPATLKPSAAPAAPAPADAPLRPQVLAVAAEPGQLPPLSDYLAAAGYEVLGAVGVPEMQHRLKARRPFAIAIDRTLIENETTGPAARNLAGRIPMAAFTMATDGQLTFVLIKPGAAAPGPGRARLMDAIRQTDTTTGKEVHTVVVMEDEETCAELLGNVLVRRGFQVLLARNGRQGLEYVTQHHPDVIILDLVMPELDGAQVVEQLRANPATRSIPIMLHTGTVLAAEDHQRLAQQVQSITSKMEPDRLLENVERLDYPGS